MSSTLEVLQTALQYHQAGRLQEAEALYRRILQVEPNHSDALHLLGEIAHRVGRHEIAVEYISRAIGLNPAAAEFHNNLGEAYRALGKLKEAHACYQCALSIKPGFAEALYNLGGLLKGQGDLEDAITSYRQAIAIKPDYVEAYNNLGNALLERGQMEEAEVCYQRVLALKPLYAEAHNNLGNVRRVQGRLDKAVDDYRQALALKPAYAEAHNNLGIALQEQGRLDEAIGCYRQALALKADFVEAHNNLGGAFQTQGKLDEAIACYRQALALRPDYVIAHSNMLFCLHNDLAYDPSTLFKFHQEWNDRHARPLLVRKVPHANRRDPDRPLRIGYVSADFKSHAVGFFFEPVLSAHDKSQVRVLCYSGVTKADLVTERMQAHADEWRNVAGLSDEHIARVVRDDAVDILVDLSGHTAGNRLLVFARKPAPVQATWIGYSDTTGLDAMDYLIADRFIAPPETAHLFTEQLAWLPSCYLCYRPPDYAPPVSRCPARSKGHITFGCFNNLTKVHAEVIAMWAQILHAVPDARLVLKSRALSDRHTQEMYGRLFLERGIMPERVDLLGLEPPHADVLALYHEIDIALDTFPYSGCTTTCEALWMGVPVVTLEGSTFISRMGVSLLSNVGVPELIAESPRRYVELAVQLSQDLDRVESLRGSLRARLAASPLCDEATFTRTLEQCYRRMWRTWCEQPR